MGWAPHAAARPPSPASPARARASRRRKPRTAAIPTRVAERGKGRGPDPPPGAVAPVRSSSIAHVIVVRGVATGSISRPAPADHDAGDSAQNTDCEDRSPENEDLRRNPDPGRAVYPYRERHRGAADEVGCHEVVNGQRERHERAGEDAGHDEWQGDLAEGDPRVRPEVGGGFLQRA